MLDGRLSDSATPASPTAPEHIAQIQLAIPHLVLCGWISPGMQQCQHHIRVPILGCQVQRCVPRLHHYVNTQMASLAIGYRQRTTHANTEGCGTKKHEYGMRARPVRS
jgi:hypothetical protein